MKILTGVPPGGAAGVVARMLAPKRDEVPGQPVVVGNESGTGRFSHWSG
ncbi:MAG: hypothetical protein WA373_01240 [Burkholderiales bacterium]